MQTRPNTSTPVDGSRTITVHDAQPIPGASNNPVESALSDGTLRLRGGPRSRPRVAWDERVVDNENCGRKKSKICCIYHRPKEFDESSDESSSEESDSESDDGRARPRYVSNRHHHHHHPPAHPSGPSPSEAGGGLRSGDDSSGGVVVHQIENSLEPNAYEVQPSHSKKEKGRMDG